MDGVSANEFNTLIELCFHMAKVLALINGHLRFMPSGGTLIVNSLTAIIPKRHRADFDVYLEVDGATIKH